jgi:hypothetical protein
VSAVFYENRELFRPPLDPNDVKFYTFRFALPPGEAIATAQVFFTDGTDATPIPDGVGVPKVLAVTFGQLDDGNYGVTWWTTCVGSTAATDATYYPHCSFTTTSSPIGESLNRTMRLRVQTLG